MQAKIVTPRLGRGISLPLSPKTHGRVYGRSCYLGCNRLRRMVALQNRQARRQPKGLRRRSRSCASTTSLSWSATIVNIRTYHMSGPPDWGGPAHRFLYLSANVGKVDIRKQQRWHSRIFRFSTATQVTRLSADGITGNSHLPAERASCESISVRTMK